MRESSCVSSFSPRSTTPSNFLSRLPEPATEHNRTGSSSLTPVEYGGIFFIRACGLCTRSSPIPGVGLSGMVPRAEIAVLSGLQFASSDFRDFRAHGPRMRIDDLSAPSGRFAARATAAITTDDYRPGREDFFLSPTLHSLRFLPYPLMAARARQKPPLPQGLSPSMLLPCRTPHREPTPP